MENYCNNIFDKSHTMNVVLNGHKIKCIYIYTYELNLYFM